MSFINIVMLPDFISIISDGQITTKKVLTQSHFKKFESNPNGFVVGITGFELITNNIRKKFYYQPNLNFEEAELLLRAELEKYKSKQVNFGQHISFNAMIAGFPLAAPSLPRAISFHVANQNISERYYEKSAILSLFLTISILILIKLSLIIFIRRIISAQFSKFKPFNVMHFIKLQTNPKRSIKLFFKK
ncbi:hypothetical protein ICE98_02901 [Lactococcus lactis]|nr:hypothetical protein [Lactococcus lactis]